MLLCPLIQTTSTPPGRDSTTCHSTAQIPAYVLLNRFLGKASRRFFTRRWYWSTTDSLSNLTTMSCSGGADKTATSRPMSSDLAEEAWPSVRPCTVRGFSRARSTTPKASDTSDVPEFRRDPSAYIARGVELLTGVSWIMRMDAASVGDKQRGPICVVRGLAIDGG